TIAVPIVQAVHDCHSFNHFAEGREAGAIELRVHTLVDEDLRRARVGSTKRKRNGAPHVRALYRIVTDALAGPGAVHSRIARCAPLHNEAIDYAIESIAVVEAVAHQVVETIRPARRPRTRNLHEEVAAVGLELRDERVRRDPLKRAVAGAGEQSSATRCMLRAAVAWLTSAEQKQAEACDQQ